MEIMNRVVTVKPLTQRAKNRVAEHGERMELIIIRKTGHALFKSLRKSWDNDTDHWLGWFKLGKEIETFQ